MLAFQKKSKASKKTSSGPSRIQRPTIEHEIRVGFPSAWIAGVDEVGRGPLAGPVVAAAVVLPEVVDYDSHPWLLKIQDSKLMSEADREEVFEKIQSWARAWAIAEVSVQEIDRLNIYHASHLAMCRAVAGLSSLPQHVLVDGNVVPKALSITASAIVKGDLKCLSIAAASVLAKVWRDRLLVGLDREYPGYGLAQHKGYPTPQHLQALQSLGVTPIHRRSFGPVAKLLSGTRPASQAGDDIRL
jgi:ribonuclease HII